MLSSKLDEIVWKNTEVKKGRVEQRHGFASLARGQQAEPCQQFDVCGYEEVLNRKGIAMGKTSRLELLNSTEI